MIQIKTVIVLVNYNGFSDTKACLKSIRKSLGELPFVVLVDNASNNSDLNELHKIYPQLKIINNTSNVGFGKANNLGIKWALNNLNSDYIFLLNNDTVLEPDAIDKLKRAVDENMNYAFSTPKIVFMESPNEIWYSGGKIDWKFGRGIVPGLGSDANSLKANISKKVTFASGCAMFFKTSVLKELGGFDPRYFMYHEDVELCLRVKESGYSIIYEPKALVYHKVQGSLRKNGQKYISGWSPSNPNLSFYVYHGVRNILLNMHDHAKGFNRLLFVFFFPVLLIKNYLESL
jgi:GT2 family glycosyltransferase